jgi:two-component system response regulator
MVKTILLIEDNADQDLIQSYTLWANSYIRKPVNFSEFKEVVNQLGFYWLMLNEPPPTNPQESD